MPTVKRVVNDVIVEDKRKFYTFQHMNGYLVETKSGSREEAKEHIEKCLETKLKEAA
ncbi:hypothetical protein KA005_01915 [bacterium]|nr:hypothetical protein [bacterium]